MNTATRVKLPTQRTGSTMPAVTTAQGIEHLPLHELPDTTGVTRRVAVFLADTPPASVDLSRVDNGDIQHPSRKIKHKVRGAVVARRERVRRVIDLREMMDFDESFATT